MIDSRTAIALKKKARQLGFSLSGIALPKTPDHFDVYQNWLHAGRHAGMQYLATQSAQDKRADPLLILPECRSILVLGVPYFNPRLTAPELGQVSQGRIASYAWGADYHLVLPERLQALVTFLEDLLGQPVPNRYYTDTGPIL